MNYITALWVFFSAFSLISKAQSTFNYNDSVFKVGQIKKIYVFFECSGGIYPVKKSLTSLDSIVVFLNKNEKLMIEIGTNTDYRGDSIFNNSLSEMRAVKIKAYLMMKGISEYRIQYKGYGESNPVIVDTPLNRQFTFLDVGQALTRNYIKKLSYDRQTIANNLNQRTEIKITRTE